MSNEPTRASLRSWKEIASYLDVTPRTAQNWEKTRGLPVHRHPGVRRSLVYAFVDEIDAWLEQNEEKPDPPCDLAAAPGEAGKVPAATYRSFVMLRRLPNRSIVTTVVLVAALLTLGTGIDSDDSDKVDPESCSIVDGSLVARDLDGRRMWSHRVPGVDPLLYGQNDGSEDCVVADIDGDGKNEVLFDAKYEDRYINGSELFCFEPGGEVRWSRVPGTMVGGSDPRIRGPFAMDTFRAIGNDGEFSVLSIAFHRPLYPSEVAILDPMTGRDRMMPFFHPGRIYAHALLDADHDGRDEVVLGGVRNPGRELGVPVLAVLDLPPDDPSKVTRDVLGGLSTSPQRYALLPDTCVARRLASISKIIQLRRTGPHSVSAKVNAGNLTVAMYEFRFPPSGPIDVVSAVVTDFYRLRHRELALMDDLDHEITIEEELKLWKLTESDYPVRDDLDLNGLVAGSTPNGQS